jgi:hypothetical protein
MRAPMPISLSTKNMRDSNIFSCIITMPSHCVAVTMAIDITSAGNAGHGWSLIVGTWPPEVRLNLPRLVREITRSSPSMSHSMPRRSKPMSVERRCSTPALENAQLGPRDRRPAR